MNVLPIHIIVILILITFLILYMIKPYPKFILQAFDEKQKTLQYIVKIYGILFILGILLLHLEYINLYDK